MKRLIGSWHCIDDKQDEALGLFGSYSTGDATNLRIHLLLCNFDAQNANNCDKIDYQDYLSDKYIVLLQNQRTFEEYTDSDAQLLE